MKHTIRFKYTMILAGVVAVVIGASWTAINLCLEPYYMREKRRTLIQANDELEERLLGDGTVTGAISSLNTGLFSLVRFYDIGKYDHTAMDLNAVDKDIYTRLLPYIGQTVIGKFVRGANYDFISSIGNEQYGFIVVISYNGEGMYLYKMVRGKMYCSTTTWVMTEV